MRQLAFSLTADAAQDGSVTRKKANNHGVFHVICALHANTSIGYRGRGGIACGPGASYSVCGDVRGGR